MSFVSQVQNIGYSIQKSHYLMIPMNCVSQATNLKEHSVFETVLCRQQITLVEKSIPRLW